MGGMEGLKSCLWRGAAVADEVCEVSDDWLDGACANSLFSPDSPYGTRVYLQEGRRAGIWVSIATSAQMGQMGLPAENRTNCARAAPVCRGNVEAPSSMPMRFARHPMTARVGYVPTHHSVPLLLWCAVRSEHHSPFVYLEGMDGH